MTTTTSIMSTSGQTKQIVRIGQDAIETAVGLVTLDKDGAQLVIERGDDLQAAIRTAMIQAVKQLSIRNEFADEETPSNYGYPAKYVIRPLAEQIVELTKHFPELSLEKTNEFIANVLPTLALPEGAEGWFAIPRWEKVASTYNEAVERMLAAIASTRTLYNYREGKLGPDRLRELERTVRMFAKIAEQQPGDILIVPAQFGKRYAGRSIRRARVVFNANEFGLGAFAVGSMVLTHPEREVKWEQLHVDCAGDEYDHPDDSQRWFNAPLFRFGDGKLGFGTRWAFCVDGVYGAASGFLPQ